MLTNLLVLLDKGAVPYCYYDNPYFYSAAQIELMPLETLQNIVCYAQKNGIMINFIYGKQPLPRRYVELIETTPHCKIIPLALKDVYEDGVLVLDADDGDYFSGLVHGWERNLILRVAPHMIGELSQLVHSLLGKFKRLNIHLTSIEYLTPDNFDNYEEELRKISAFLGEQYRDGQEIEINVLSDRMLLAQMNNCNAGQEHITIAPNGKCYICPGFYYDNEEKSLGAFSAGADVAMDNDQLLDIACAPLCAKCDAFHCKRCVYLNRKTTLEFNTPSHEQCLSSHIERDISRQLLNRLGDLGDFRNFARIPDVAYRDPFDKVTNTHEQIAEIAAAGDLLPQIFAMQRKILKTLQGG